MFANAATKILIHKKKRGREGQREGERGREMERERDPKKNRT